MRSAVSVSRSKWVWIACAALPLAAVGCQSNRAAQNPAPQDNQRVAGERQEEPRPEVLQAIRDGGLPETFMFGGRVWRGHEIHRTTRDKIGGMGSAGNPPGPQNAAKPQQGANPFDFNPVADLKVEGHTIYRKAGLDEAVTDNIFLMAENTAAAAGSGAGTTGDGTAGTTGSTPQAGNTSTGSSSANAGEVVFIEYDPTQSMDTGTDVNQVVQSASLPATVKWNGKTYTPREVQVYDPDVFDEVKAVSGISGMSGSQHAYQGDKKDELFLMGEVSSMPMGGGTAGTVATGNENAPATTGENAPSASTGSANETMFTGPIFVRYEAAKGDHAGGSAAGTGTDTSAPGPR